MLHRAYEQLMVQASVDPVFGALLLTDPCQAALDANCSPMLAESLVGLRAGTLAEFAAALYERVYGCGLAQSQTYYPAISRVATGYAQ